MGCGAWGEVWEAEGFCDICWSSVVMVINVGDFMSLNNLVFLDEKEKCCTKDYQIEKVSLGGIHFGKTNAGEVLTEGYTHLYVYIYI